MTFGQFCKNCRWKRNDWVLDDGEIYCIMLRRAVNTNDDIEIIDDEPICDTLRGLSLYHPKESE